MITIVKKDKITHNIETVVQSMRLMYKKSSLVVECGKKVTGLVELIFNESDNQAMVIRIRRNIGSSNFTDYIVNKDTLREFKIDDIQLGVTMKIARVRGGGRPNSIVMYFLACLTPVLVFPKVPSGDIIVTRSDIDRLRLNRCWEEVIKSLHG